MTDIFVVALKKNVLNISDTFSSNERFEFQCAVELINHTDLFSHRLFHSPLPRVPIIQDLNACCTVYLLH